MEEPVRTYWFAYTDRHGELVGTALVHAADEDEASLNSPGWEQFDVWGGDGQVLALDVTEHAHLIRDDWLNRPLLPEQTSRLTREVPELDVRQVFDAELERLAQRIDEIKSWEDE